MKRFSSSMRWGGGEVFLTSPSYVAQLHGTGSLDRVFRKVHLVDSISSTTN